MAYTIPTLTELSLELMELVKNLEPFQGYGYVMYNLDDFMDQTAFSYFPSIGVVYNGGALVENDAQTRTKGSVSASLIMVQFSLVIAIQYTGHGGIDRLNTGIRLLDATRPVVNGYKGVNSRPWFFVNEGPAPQARADGVVFFLQNWATYLPCVGVHPNRGYGLQNDN